MSNPRTERSSKKYDYPSHPSAARRLLERVRLPFLTTQLGGLGVYSPRQARRGVQQAEFWRGAKNSHSWVSTNADEAMGYAAVTAANANPRRIEQERIPLPVAAEALAHRAVSELGLID